MDPMGILGQKSTSSNFHVLPNVFFALVLPAAHKVFQVPTKFETVRLVPSAADPEASHLGSRQNVLRKGFPWSNPVTWGSHNQSDELSEGLEGILTVYRPDDAEL